jgi:hypothetical protein
MNRRLRADEKFFHITIHPVTGSQRVKVQGEIQLLFTKSMIPFRI